jgi:phosphatidylinositol glycan class B
VHYDEHFQLLEFANFKYGHTPEGDLPWEYLVRIRPWFQPVVALGVIRALDLIGAFDPFRAAALLRLLSGLLSWAALVRLVQASRPWFACPAARRYAIVASCFLWFTPFLAVRFSSESWSGSIFFLAFSVLILDVQSAPAGPAALAGAGIGLALAVAARYQALIMVGSGLAWWLWVRRPAPRAMLQVALGLLAGGGANLLLDRWGYGRWGLTPWRYVDYQVLQGVAAGRFGHAPWWWYFPKLVLLAGPPIGALILVGAALLVVKRPRSPLTWTALPFLAVHCILAHKELRFLFPLAPLAGFIACQSLDLVPRLLRWGVARPVRPVVWALLAANGLGLILRAAVPPHPEVELQRAIYQSGARHLLIVGGQDPYALGGLRVVSHYYRRPDLVTVNLTDASGAAIPDELRHPGWVVWSDYAPLDTTAFRCQTAYQIVPSWARSGPLAGLIRPLEPANWVLARCVAGEAGTVPPVTGSAPEAHSPVADAAPGAGTARSRRHRGPGTPSPWSDPGAAGGGPAPVAGL